MPELESKEALYAILNLPVSVSQDDIHHRYKELAVIFHPDRQHHRDEHSVKVAEDRFRQIQRAYEVLTDPLQRQMYDALGDQGIELGQKLQLSRRFSSSDELRAELQNLLNLTKKNNQTLQSFRSQGELTCALDCTTVFDRKNELSPSKRLAGIQKLLLRVSHTMGVTVRPGTEMSLTGRLQAIPARGSPRDYGQLEGTIRHQFSPRLAFEVRGCLALGQTTPYQGTDQATARLYRAHHIVLKATYGARMAFELQRRLFPKSTKVGKLSFSTAPQPLFDATISSSQTSKDLFVWSTGLRLSPLPTIMADLASSSFPGGLTGKIQLERGALEATKANVIGAWAGSNGTVISISTSVTTSGVVGLQLQGHFLGTRITVPIVLAYEADVIIGLCALLAPSVIATVCYNFAIRPWLRARRLVQLREKREMHRDGVEQRRREAGETVSMLSDSARRRTEHERRIGGLVLLTASYGTSGEDEEEAVLIDVTVALQAQVRDSQLTIPGGRSKSELLGFYDPSPGARKRLKIEYSFHGTLHQVEAGDFSAVILPLRAHLVD